MRIGQGIDVHAFGENLARPLILGGVVLAGARGLDGHSDADVVCHAIIDSLLGAANLGDLGRHFPSTDASLAGVSSLILLEKTMNLLDQAGWEVQSVDVTIVAQSPQMAHHIPAMAAVLHERIGVEVSVKATTTDHLGFLGRGEGIAALSIALVEER
jgi:2-C-methyl-D-erythritol 2,4-cyclodiphosphate synthase